MFIRRQNIKFILHDSLEILERYSKLIVLGNLGMPGYANSKWYFCDYFSGKKINFTPHAFLEVLQRYVNFLF